MKRISLSVFTASLLLLGACSVGDSGGGPSSFGRALTLPKGNGERIFGKYPLEPVLQDGANIAARYRPFIDAYGILDTGCSATHIGNGLVVTAGHCFGATATREDNTPCASNQVKWGVRKDRTTPYLISTCQMVLAKQQSNDVDYAFFTVSPVPPVQVDVDLDGAAPGTSLAVFGFPQLLPLQLSHGCTLEPSSNGPFGAMEFSHQCDTDAGSSGSAVLDDATVKLVGIHNGGNAAWNYGSLIQDTPLAEILAGQGQTDGGVTDGGVTDGCVHHHWPDASWGPFDYDYNATLLTLPSTEGSRVSFTLSIDTESGYDFVSVKGADVAKRLTGVVTRRFVARATPVSISIDTDGDVPSHSVAVSDISFSN